MDTYQEYLETACGRLGIGAGQVVGSRIEGQELVILANYGIGGIKKHRLALGGLAADSAPEAAPADIQTPAPAIKAARKGKK